MIRIALLFDGDKRLEEITISGHAPVRESFSLECAVVSGIVEVLSLEVNTLMEKGDFREVKEKGYWSMKFHYRKKEIPDTVEKLFFAKLLVLKKLSHDFPDTVKFEQSLLS